MTVKSSLMISRITIRAETTKIPITPSHSRSIKTTLSLYWTQRLPRAKTEVGTVHPAAKVTPTPKQITIGCDVVLNGRVHYDSYGAKPGKTFTNYRGKVNFINKKGSHPYHVTTPDGSWLGWVTAESVVLA